MKCSNAASVSSPDGGRGWVFRTVGGRYKDRVSSCQTDSVST